MRIRRWKFDGIDYRLYRSRCSNKPAGMLIEHGKPYENSGDNHEDPARQIQFHGETL
jgi:hypothetical protein